MKLSFQNARAAIHRFATPSNTELVPIENSSGRVAAQTLKSRHNTPAFIQSSMDGFAVKYLDIADKSLPRLTISGESAAGNAPITRLQKHSAMRIMTGARLPQGADTVVPLEHCSEERGFVTIHRLPKIFANIRKPGDDFKKNRVIIKDGSEIFPDHLPLLAEYGYFEFPVYQRPDIAVLTTGSELISPGTAIASGLVVSGNNYLLQGLLKQHRIKCSIYGPVDDNADLLRSALTGIIASSARIIITTGGTGPGKYDLIGAVFEQLAINTIFSGIAMRPGSGAKFGILADKLIFALPGPPGVVRLLFNELVLPALKKMQGLKKQLPSIIKAEAEENIVLKKGCFQLKGGILRTDNGRLKVRPAQKYEAIDCVILLPAHRSRIRPGEQVHVHLT